MVDGQNDVSRMLLNKLQRLTCLAIKGAINMIPTATMEDLLGLPLLH